jgi:uncharacterized RDD family membrane protein YckC
MSTTPPGTGPAYGTPPPPAAEPYPATYAPPLSSAGKRFGAYLLEALLIIVTLFIGWLVWSLIVWGRGLTPAKQLLKMQCVDANTGQVAGWGTMALRELVGKVLLGNVTFGITTIIGGVMVLTDDRRQAIWDKIATTVVVDMP